MPYSTALNPRNASSTFRRSRLPARAAKTRTEALILPNSRRILPSSGPYSPGSLRRTASLINWLTAGDPRTSRFRTAPGEHQQATVGIGHDFREPRIGEISTPIERGQLAEEISGFHTVSALALDQYVHGPSRST